MLTDKATVECHICKKKFEWQGKIGDYEGALSAQVNSLDAYVIGEGPSLTGTFEVEAVLQCPYCEIRGKYRLKTELTQAVKSKVKFLQT